MTRDNPARRAFLLRMGRLAAAGAAAPLGLQLAAMGEAAAMTAGDYKALVCVFLHGGNDYANTVVTYDEPSHARYAAVRLAGAQGGGDGIAIGRSALQATVLTPARPLPDGRAYALHPSMPQLAALFNSGRAAVQLNLGPLQVPLTRQQYESGLTQRWPLPPKLFSHNDQQSMWQALSAEGAATGWGGRLGDLALSSNGGSLFTCISVAGNSPFLTGASAAQYHCSTDGAVSVRSLNDGFFHQDAMRAAFHDLVQQPYGHVLMDAYNGVMRRALTAETTVSNAVSRSDVQTRFAPGNRLAAQLRMVARLIGARESLGVRRQVFMVSLGGFDLHDNLLSRQPILLQQVDEALSAFYQATLELGVADKVTAFTASDFGRTLTSNGNGSDHGWGSHHFVVGGAVKGGAFYGEAPPVSVGDTDAPEDQWHVGQGRLLPRTSVSQFAATLAAWFGVGPDEQRLIVPNLDRFGIGAGGNGIDYPLNLGFL